MSLPVIWVFRASTWVVRVETSFSLFVSFSRVSNRKNKVINTGIENIFHILKCLSENVYYYHGDSLCFSL